MAALISSSTNSCPEPGGYPLLGAIEGGGTKFVLGVGDASGSIRARHTIPTRRPDETIAEALAWFAGRPPVVAVGLASFGPVGLDPVRSDYGHVLATPKPGWAGYDLAGAIGTELGVPVGLDTDVNAAALAEWRLGAGVGGNSLAYMTVGTGVGVGLVLEGRPIHGAAHPEAGHAFPRRDPDDADFAGICPFHGDCLEGLASGPAILARWGATLSGLPPDHPAHARIAGYLAQACHTLFAVTAVETIVLGGGVMATPGLVERVDEATKRLGGEYLPGRKRHRICAPGLGSDSGLAGALLLAKAVAGGSGR